MKVEEWGGGLIGDPIFIHIKTRIWRHKHTDTMIYIPTEITRTTKNREGSPKDEGFLPWGFLRGFCLNRILNKCSFYFYPVFYSIYILMGTLPVFIFLFTVGF